MISESCLFRKIDQSNVPMPSTTKIDFDVTKLKKLVLAIIKAHRIFANILITKLSVNYSCVLIGQII